MNEHVCKPEELMPGYYWYREDGKREEVVEKCENEPFVRFTNGRRISSIGRSDKFYGPLQSFISRGVIKLNPEVLDTQFSGLRTVHVNRLMMLR